MPSLGSHLASARVLANRLAQPSIDADRGSYYLGATAPDIRVLTRLDREHTHFFTLEVVEKQDSVARMFEAFPYLAEAGQLDATTRAFMAGYLTHLLMDQRYIETIYRQFFGADSVYGDDPMANVLDRVLQYEMERREREDIEAMAEIRSLIADCGGVADVRFIEGPTLLQWRDVAHDVASHPPTWERFERIASRHLQGAGLVTEEQMRDFYRDLPRTLEQALEHVTEARIADFLDATLEETSAQLQEYLR
jgi:hypothetical protein